MATPLINQPPSGGKLCSICGVDCTNKPRTKDEKGRYICADCIAKAKETKQVLANPPKPKPAPEKGLVHSGLEEDNSFLLELGGQALATEQGKECPKCGVMRTSRDILCLSCGYNFETGKQVKVKVEKAKVVREPGAPKPAGDNSGTYIALLGVLGGAIVIGVIYTMLPAKGSDIVTASTTMITLRRGFRLALSIPRFYVAYQAWQEGSTIGFLTFLIPFYDLYYAFSISDDPWVRAAVLYQYTAIIGIIALTFR